MIKKLLILTILTLTTLFSYTQVNYPKLIVSNGDTLVLQTIEQTKWVSKQIEIGKACELSGIQKDSIINRKTMNETNLNQIITVKNELISSKDSTILDKDKIISSHIKINDDLIKENKKLKIKNTLILIGTGIITTLLIIF